MNRWPVAYEDLALLVKVARRAFDDRASDKPETGTRYTPPALRGLKAVVHLTLRLEGRAVAEAESREIEVVDAAASAGTILATTLREKQTAALPSGLDMAKLGAFGLEFELLGPPEYLDFVLLDEGGTWSDQLIHGFEPGIEGIGVEFRGHRAWTRPGEIISRNYTPDLAIQAAEATAGVRHIHKTRAARDIRYFRFRTHHLWQPSAGDLPVVLVRGATLVPAESIGPDTLDAAIRRMGAYLHYRQNSDGWFAPSYLPSADRYSQRSSMTAQMEALHGLAAYAAWSGQCNVVADVANGLDQVVKNVRPMQVGRLGEEGTPQAPPRGLVLWSLGEQQDHLTGSSRLLMALSAYRRAVELADERPSTQPSTAASSPATSPGDGSPPPFDTYAVQWRGLVDGILGSQDSDGRIEMIFRARTENEPDDAAAAGRALRALAGSQSSPGDAGIERAIQRSLGFYDKRRDQLDLPAACSLAHAFTLGYSWTNDAQCSQFAFDVLDRVVALQVTPAGCPWPELHGAINAREDGAVGADTATYLAALADGLAMAERIGGAAGAERIHRYRQAVLAAARFVLQLEVRADGTYYMQSPRDALGGLRSALWDNEIRADHCASALIGLIRAREALYPSPGPARP